ncbi:hypothetical protein HMPREF9372_3535, partial [Sporosarcina newyorkensis 2681]
RYMEVDAILPKIIADIIAVILKINLSLLLLFCRKNIIMGKEMLAITNKIFKRSLLLYV